MTDHAEIINIKPDSKGKQLPPCAVIIHEQTRARPTRKSTRKLLPLVFKSGLRETAFYKRSASASMMAS